MEDLDLIYILPKTELRPGAKLLWLWLRLMKHRDEISFDEMGMALNRSQPSVQRDVEQLAYFGLLEVEKKFGCVSKYKALARGRVR